MSEHTECGPACSNRHPCTCASTDCKNHGRCCDCVAYHKSQGTPPVCIQQMLAAQGK